MILENIVNGFKEAKTNLKTKLKNYLIPIALGTVISIGGKAVANNSFVHYEATATQNGDVNGDRKIDINDVNYLLAYLYSNGKEPVPIVTGLPDTGQTKCYNDVEEIPCPQPGEPFYGQDGNYQTGAPRKFEVVKPNPHDDSTWYTIDYVTGLMWQYASDSVPRLWQGALSYCENLTLGGFSDWRLPNVRELESIVDYGKSPAIDTNSFFYESEKNRYWSSTTVVKWPHNTFCVNFVRGGTPIEDKKGGGGRYHFFVRAVRTIQASQNGDVNDDSKIDKNDVHYLLEHLFNEGPAPVPIITGLPVTGQTKCYDNEKEILCPIPGQPFYGQDGNYQTGAPRKFEVVKPNPHDESTWYTIDYVTGLMWQYANDGIVRHWQYSLAYCENLELGGFNDWRLPNVRELESIVDYIGYEPAIDPNFFLIEGGDEIREYWISTNSVTSTNYAFVVPFYIGGINIAMKDDTYSLNRAVRAIQPGDFPEREKTLEADLNNDGIVNLEDLAILGEQWLMTEEWYGGE